MDDKARYETSLIEKLSTVAVFSRVFNQLAVANSLPKTKSMYLKCAAIKLSADEYTRQTRNMRGCCNMELSCNETTVLFFLNRIIDRIRRDVKYCHFLVSLKSTN